MFQLDPRLQNDCHILTNINSSQILLMNNSLVPWIIIVPETNETELYQLEPQQKIQVYQSIDSISEFIKKYFSIEKLNVAALGNVVKQLHIHIIGRKTTDPAWPNPIWGNIGTQPYTKQTVQDIQKYLLNHLQ